MSNKVAIIASNGGLFDAYKVFNIATAAAASEKEVAIFFTFEGLNLIHKQGMQALTNARRKRTFCGRFCKSKCTCYSRISGNGTRIGVKFIACQMTMDVMGLTKEDFVDGIEVGGAVTFLEFAKDASPTLTF